VIIKGMILLWIEHFKHRRGRVTPMIHSHFIDLIQQEQRIPNARF